jgi:hypothetical protein
MRRILALSVAVCAVLLTGCEGLPDIGSLGLGTSNKEPIEIGASYTDVDLGALGLDIDNTSENQLCMQAVSYACSEAHLGLQAPFCTVAQANNCGVIPKNVGDTADVCFTNTGLGLLDEGNSRCRYVAIDSGIKIAPAAYRVPVGQTPSIWAQQQEMVSYKYSNVIHNYVDIGNGPQSGMVRCQNSSRGPSLVCLKNHMSEFFVSAEGQRCDMTFAEHYKAGLFGWDSLIKDRCSIRKDELERRFSPQLPDWRRAYAWRSIE